MLDKMAVYMMSASAKLQSKAAEEDGSEILQVVGISTAIMLILAGIISVSGDAAEGFGTQVTGILRNWISAVGGGG